MKEKCIKNNRKDFICDLYYYEQMYTVKVSIFYLLVCKMYISLKIVDQNEQL